MGLREGMFLLDLGCGSGFTSIPAAKAVGTEGHVYAVDIDEVRLSALARRVRAEGLKNLTPIRTYAWNIDQVQPSSIDVALMFFSLHHFEKMRESLREAYSKLKHEGRLYIYEPIKSRMAGHGTDMKEIIGRGLKEGFILKSLKTGLLTYRLELLKP